jgi:hypothetical protein
MNKRSIFYTFVIVLGLQGAALAGPVEEGRAHFQHAVELHRDGDLRGALAEFQKANEVSPSFRILYNIGQTEAELGNYVEAIKTLEQYLLVAGGQITAERRTEASEDIQRLRTRVGKLIVKSNVVGGEVLIDGVSVARLPLSEPLVLNVGKRAVMVREGSRVQSMMYEVIGGESQTLELLLPPPLTAKTIVRSEEPSPSRAPVWISLGVGVLAGAGAITFGVLGITANNQHKDELARPHLMPYDAQGAATTIHRYALAADILTSVAAGAGILAIYFATRGPKTPRVGVGPTSLTFQGTF